MAEWDADLIVDAETLRRAAGSPKAWRLLASGWDSNAWLADESVIWRAPRRLVGITALRREAALLPRIAPLLPATVPVPVLVERDGLPLLARHALVPGCELAAVPDLPASLGGALGRFLAALHAPELARLAATLVPTDPLGRADAAKRIGIAHRRLDDVSARLDTAPYRAIVDAAEGLELRIDVLCHGDLHIRHVLLGDASGLSGVIDWGDSCLGACAMDLAVVTALPAAARAAFAAAYGEVDAASWTFARMLAVMFAASLLAAAPDGESGRGARRWLETLAAG
jgi:aminoglycoside phosphotransferase (APT) family kinase protein